MDRRPHWDDDLVTAVCSAVSPGLYLTSDQVFRIIAAVEDWQEQRFYNFWVSRARRLDSAEAAIQRVRGVIDEWEYRPPTSLIEQMRNALDGPQ